MTALVDASLLPLRHECSQNFVNIKLLRRITRIKLSSSKAFMYWRLMVTTSPEFPPCNDAAKCESLLLALLKVMQQRYFFGIVILVSYLILTIDHLEHSKSYNVSNVIVFFEACLKDNET